MGEFHSTGFNCWDGCRNAILDLLPHLFTAAAQLAPTPILADNRPGYAWAVSIGGGMLLRRGAHRHRVAPWRLTSVCSWRSGDLRKTFICVAAEGLLAAETRSVRQQRHVS